MSKKDFWDGYVPETTYTFKLSDPIIGILDLKPNYNMVFHNGGKQVGVLDFNGPEMVFNGDMNESAKVFFDFIASAFKGRLEQERADEREACAKVCEQGVDTEHPTVKGHIMKDLGASKLLAAAIRARSNT